MKLLFLLSSLLLLQSLLLFVFNFAEIFAEPLLKSATDFKVYQNKNHSFELMYPLDWTFIEFKDQFFDIDLNVVASFISPLNSSLDTFQEYFTIKTKIQDPKDTFSNHFKLYLEKLKKSIANITISKVEDISDKNKYITYSFSPQPGLVINKSEYIFLNNDNKIFHLEFNSNNNDKTFESLIKKIVSHFRVT